MVKRFEIYLLNLDPEVSDEPKNSRPCVVISPDEMNRNVESIIVAPISSVDEDYPTRIKFEFLEKHRAAVLDQIRTVEKNATCKKDRRDKRHCKTKNIECSTGNVCRVMRPPYFPLRLRSIIPF